MKKYPGKKAVILLLILSMLSPAMLSCSDNTADNKTETEKTPDSQASGGETVGEESEESSELQPDIPKLDFDGATFTFLTSGPNDTNGVDWETYDVWTDTLNAEPINDSIYERNAYINDTYNVTIAEYKTAKDTLSEIKTEVAASSGTFQAAMTHFENAANLSQQGALLNLYSLPYIDTSRPWWDHRAKSDLEVVGKLFIATGDITVIDNDATWVLFFNKQMRDDLQLDNFYDLVREDKWYFDTFASTLQVAASDVNGDGKMSYKDDIYGMIAGDSQPYGFLHASGIKLVTKGKDEIFKITENTEQIAKIVEMAGKVVSDNSTTLVTGQQSTKSDDIRIAFEEGKGLFFGEVMQCATRMRSSETDFGLLPWPKYEESQQEYYNWIHSSAGRGVVIPSSVPESQYEMVGAIIEAVAAKSLTTLTEAYYDKSFTYKSLRDEDSVEMLEIILQSRTYDLSRIYALNIDSSIATLINKGSTDVASTWARSLKLASKILERAVMKYEALQ